MTDLNQPPQTFLKTVSTESDAKKLLNWHRILHAWMAECQAGTPRKSIGENNWTPRWIKPAHDVVIRRIQQLRPDFKNETPMGAAILPVELEPIMLIPGYVAAVGSSVKENKLDSDLDILVKDDEDESMGIRMTQTFGDKAHVIFNKQGSHDENKNIRELYHLVLMPVDAWDAGRPDRLEAAMSEYKNHLGPMMKAPAMRRRTIFGAGLIHRRLWEANDISDAKMLGVKIARHVLAGESLFKEDQDSDLLMAADWEAEELFAEAKAVYEGKMMPVTNQRSFKRGLEKIQKMIKSWQENNPFESKGMALLAARVLGEQTAEDQRG